MLLEDNSMKQDAADAQLNIPDGMLVILLPVKIMLIIELEGAIVPLKEEMLVI